MRKHLALFCLAVCLSGPAFGQSCKGRPISDWISGLDDLSSTTVQQTAYTLGDCGTGAAAALPRLEQGALNPANDIYERLSMATAVFQIDRTGGQPEILAFVTGVLQPLAPDKAPPGTVRAVWALGAAGPRACGAVPLLKRVAAIASIQTDVWAALKKIGSC